MKLNKKDTQRILIEDILNYHKQGYNLPDISEATGVKVDKIKYILKQQGMLKYEAKEKK